MVLPALMLVWVSRARTTLPFDAERTTPLRYQEKCVAVHAKLLFIDPHRRGVRQRSREGREIDPSHTREDVIVVLAWRVSCVFPKYVEVSLS